VLAGGRSPEREVSLRSGHRVHHALTGRGHESFVLDPSEAPLVEGLATGGAEVCYLALHGRDGEDGTIQRLLELIGLPYTGTGPFECQVAFDKVLAKEALRAAGVPTPAWATIQAAALKDLSAGHILDVAAERVGFPAVVKPARSGSAMGVRFVDRAADLPAAVMSALSFSDAAIIERRKVAAGLVGNPPEPLPLVEIVPKSGVYDYASRYTAGATEYFAPARLAPETASVCSREASRSFEALGLRDVTRVDLIVDREGRPWVLEVNVSPGMTETSLLPMAAEAAGMSLELLCERILEAAVDRGLV
jgi:D-alanine-D-alanine ligase